MSIRTLPICVQKSAFLIALLPALYLQASPIQAQPVFDDGFELPENCGLACDGDDGDFCKTGILDCGGPGIPVCTEAQSFVETCNGSDDDCDELVDGSDPSLQLVACEIQAGVCSGSMKSAAECLGASGWAACSAASYTSHSPNYQASETMCDGLDNDCDGVVDDVAGSAPLNANQLGLCAGTVRLCMGVSGWVDNYSSVPTYGMPEFGCNGIDENCDGMDGQVSDNCSSP